MILDLIQAMSRAEEGLRSWLGEDLMHSQTLLLYLLLERGKTAPSTLADQMNLSRGRMSHLLDDMEAEDLLLRKPDPEDGRGYLIDLTAHGRGQAKLARKRVLGLQAEIKQTLGEAGLAMLLQQLQEVALLNKLKTKDQ